METGNELLYRTLPSDVSAEQAVLGAMLIDSDCIKDVMDQLRADDFYLQQNRDIFETMYTMFSYSRPIDAITLVHELEKSETFDRKTAEDYLIQLMEVTPTSANVMAYVEILQGKTLLRRLAIASGEIGTLVQEGLGEPSDLLEIAEQKIYAIRQGRSSRDMTPIGTVMAGVMAHIEKLASEGAHMPGISTGFSLIDRKLSGLNRSDLILLAARPGMGKTSLALNIALNVGKATKKTVAIFSLEMSKEQLAIRLLANEALVENRKLLCGDLSESDWANIANGAASLSQTDIRLDDDPLLTVSDMNAKCRRLDNLALVVIDYLQLMSSAGGKTRQSENRQQAVSEISRMLKIMAKELQVPVLCLSQLTRANERRDDKRPQLSDLRESGAIEQDADSVLFIYREDYYKPDTDKRNIAELIVAKNRHGETGKVELKWMPEYTTFNNLDNRYDAG